jgi:hypothetical protein
MKTYKLRLANFTAAATLVAATLSTHAQTWETVFPNAASGDVAGVSGDIGTDASGSSVCTAGRFIDETTGHSTAVVLELDNLTGNWVPLDDYAEAGLNYAHNRAFAADPVTGHLFAGGNLNNILPNGAYEYDALWFIREGDPQTGEWTTVDDSLALLDDGVGQASCADILVTPFGDVYAAGGGQLGWLVRKRAAGAGTFVPADVDYSGQSSGSAWDMAYHPTYGVFAVGEVNGFWTVRRRSNGDLESWQTKDTFTVRRQWGGGRASSVLVASNGEIYVAGRALQWNTGANHWVVRRSTNGGETWSVVDSTLVTGSGEPTGIAEVANDRIVVCGFAGMPGDLHWIVRRGQEVKTTSTKKGKTVTSTVWEWTTLDDYQPVTGTEWRANAITVNAQGDLYVSGRGVDATGVGRFIVRRLPAP